MRVVGIDPGGTGAAVSAEADGGKVVPIGFHLLRWHETGRAAKDLDVVDLMHWVGGQSPDLVALEMVQYMGGRRDSGGQAGQGGGNQASMFSTAAVVGTYREILGALKMYQKGQSAAGRNLVYRTVVPRTWQSKTIGTFQSVKGEKLAARRKRLKAAVLHWAKTTYPTFDMVPPKCRVPHEGVVDAAAIAHWAALHGMG